MIEPTDSNKKRKLPARYPREQEIMVFGDMSELDHVLELLTGLAEHLCAAPETITSEEWERWCSSPLAHLAKVLCKAYVEYERFWQHDGWKLGDDPTLSSDLSDFHEMHWRVKELEAGLPIEIPCEIRSGTGVVKYIRHALSYDPAQLACAQSLYMALTLMQNPGDKDWVEYCIGSLRQELTRYHAAALEVLLGRNKVFLAGRSKGAVSASTKHIRTLAKDNLNLTAKELFVKANKSIIGDMLLDTFSNQVTEARKIYPKEKKPAK